MNLKAVIFDMDGVMLDSEPLHLEASCIMLRKYGIDIDHLEVTPESLGASYETMWRVFAEKYRINKDIASLVEEQHECTYEYFKRIDFEEHEGLTQLIRDIKNNNVICSVASASPIKVVELVINKLHLGDFIDTFCAAEMVSKQKPDPEIYNAAVKKLNLDPQECIAIEDSPTGVSAAKAAGLKCVAYNSSEISEESLNQANMIINKLTEIDCSKLKTL